MFMKNEKKKGLLERLFGSNKDKKGSCCGSFELEELPEENAENKNQKNSPQNNASISKGGSGSC